MQNMHVKSITKNMKIKLCEMCNSQVNDNDKFCTKCGNKFTMN